MNSGFFIKGFFLLCSLLSISCHLLERPSTSISTPPVSPSVSSPVSPFISSAPSASSTSTQASHSSLEMELKALKAQKKSKPLPQRLKEVENFIQKIGDSKLSLKAYLLKVEILLEHKQPDKACQVYHQATQLPFSYKGYGPALRESARCYFKKGMVSQAEKALDRLIEEERADLSLRLFFSRMKWKFLKKTEGREESKLKALSQILSFSSSLREKQTAEREAEALIQKFSPEDQLSLANRAFQQFPELEALLFYRAGNAFFAEKKFNKAKKLFKKAKSLKLSSPYLKLALLRKLKWIKQSRRLNPYLIGVIVPLSGKRKALGEKILRGLYMGLDIERGAPWQLVVVDSKSQPDLARSRLENLFYKHHIVAVIGGLGGETAQALAEKAEALGLPSLVFSQKMGLSQNRDFVFQNALTADQILNPLIGHAVKDLKIKKVALLSPDDAYGKEYAGLFAEVFEKAGGELAGEEFYPSGEEDFKKQIKNLLHLNIKGREKEFKKLREEFLSQNPQMSRQSKKLLPENLLPKKQDFSALFIPDSLSRLKKIKDYLKYFDLKDVFLLGTDLWQRDNVIGKGEEYPLLFAGLPQEKAFKHKAFYRDFARLYSRPPGVFEQRAYDAALFLKKALKQKTSSRQKLQTELRKIKHFEGAFYEISISSQGIFQYPLKVYSHPSSLPPALLPALPPALPPAK